MKRILATGLSLALVVLLAACSAAQKKKGKPEAFLDEKSAGPDFAVQGEYAGDYVKPLDEKVAALSKVGAQVVALGDGKFDVYLLQGGLPGAGWDGGKKQKKAAVRTGDKAEAT